MSTRVQQSIIINRPVEKVFAYITDYRNAPKWQPTILETRVTPEGPAQEGMRVTDVTSFMTSKISSVYKITALDPTPHVTFERMSGPFPYHGNISSQPLTN